VMVFMRSFLLLRCSPPTGFFVLYQSLRRC
jgi:hypothetical protein